MRMRITAPVEGYSGEGPGGLRFVDGTADTDDIAVIGYCQGAGYGVEPLDDGSPPSVEDPDEDAPQAKAAGRTRSRKGGDA